MSFNIGDRVRDNTKWPELNGRLGTVEETEVMSTYIRVRYDEKSPLGSWYGLYRDGELLRDEWTERPSTAPNADRIEALESDVEALKFIVLSLLTDEQPA